MKSLVIVESPAKKEKIEKFLNTIPGCSFTVEASFGHICYFSDGLKSIDIENNFKAKYGIINDKKKVVKRLKEVQKKVDNVIIATDLDREGEAIGYHIARELKLDINKTKRICFNEITEKAVLYAYTNSRKLDENLFNAQQARSILDILIGFELSPLLMQYIQPKLSGGRCQSPALRLIKDREDKIESFISEKIYIINGEFTINGKSIDTTYYEEIKNSNKIRELLPKLISYKYKISKIIEKKLSQSAPAPYITSSIQQDCNSRFGLSPKITMQILQKLYEKGLITYMRTDSNKISEDFMKQIKNYTDNENPGFFKENIHKSKTSNAQEAHECIRPVKLINQNELDNFNLDDNELKLYNMIGDRTLMSQMKKYKENSFEYTLTSIEDTNCNFYFTLKKTTDIGFKLLSTFSEHNQKDLIDHIKENDIYKPNFISGIEKNTKAIGRFTEASLIKELENKGIGRPSTFASIISKLFDRKYALKEKNHNYKENDIEKYTIIRNEDLKEELIKKKSDSQKGKIFITETGKLVTDFINTEFREINSYNLTSIIENELDKICNGEIVWYEVIKKLYEPFHRKILALRKNCKTKQTYKNKKLNLLGNHDNINIYTYIGKYGPCIQYGEQSEQPRYVGINKDEYPDIKKMTLENAITLLKYPLKLGLYNDIEIFVKKSSIGLYIQYGDKTISVENDNIDLDNVINLIEEKEKNNRLIEIGKYKILTGKFGPYIKNGNKNISIPKNIDLDELTEEKCEELIKKKTNSRYQHKKFTKSLDKHIEK